jgi:hypothetical protein
MFGKFCAACGCEEDRDVQSVRMSMSERLFETQPTATASVRLPLHPLRTGNRELGPLQATVLADVVVGIDRGLRVQAIIRLIDSVFAG